MDKPQVVASEIMHGLLGDGWVQLACIDRMVELGELVEVNPDASKFDQHRIYARPSYPENR